MSEFSCLLGTLVQEVHQSHPVLLDAAEAGMWTHIDEMATDIAAAKALYAPDADWSPESLATFVQATLQGSFIHAKAMHGPGVVRSNLAHVRRYLETLLPGCN